MAVQAKTSRASRGSKARWRPGRVRVMQFALVVALLLAWELAGRRVGAFILAPPSALVAAFGRMLASGELLFALRNSLFGLLVGFTVAVVIGIPLGFLMGWYGPVATVLNPFVSALYAVPIAALVPLLIVWLGIGTLPRIVTIVLFAVFEIVIATYTAVKQVDGRLVEMARSYGASRGQLFRKVAFFDALPMIAAGIRIGAGRAIKGMVVAELLFAATGLGGLVSRYAAYYKTDQVLVVVVVVSLLGVALVTLLRRVEHRIAPWYYRKES